MYNLHIYRIIILTIILIIIFTTNKNKRYRIIYKILLITKFTKRFIDIILHYGILLIMHVHNYLLKVT